MENAKSPFVVNERRNMASSMKASFQHQRGNEMQRTDAFAKVGVQRSYLAVGITMPNCNVFLCPYLCRIV